MSQKLIVNKGYAVCPCCNVEFDVQSKVNGGGSKPQGNKQIRKVTKGYKLEILNAYLKDPEKVYTVKEIMARINFTRYTQGITRRVEQCNLSRPHGELMDADIIMTLDDTKQPYIHKIDVEKAKAVLLGTTA